MRLLMSYLAFIETLDINKPRNAATLALFFSSRVFFSPQFFSFFPFILFSFLLCLIMTCLFLFKILVSFSSDFTVGSSLTKAFFCLYCLVFFLLYCLIITYVSSFQIHSFLFLPLPDFTCYRKLVLCQFYFFSALRSQQSFLLFFFCSIPTVFSFIISH